MKLLSDLSASTAIPTGDWVRPLISPASGRHLLLLPFTKRAIIQYCCKILINALKIRILADPKSCSDTELGNLLVLLQVDWPEEQPLAEFICDCISVRGHFTYLQFGHYIVCPDLIEQFMSMWCGDVHLEFIVPPQMSCGGGGSGGGSAVTTTATSAAASAAAASRRIGTRGADKGVKDDFKQFMKQQILKGFDVEMIVQRFVQAERGQLLQSLGISNL